MNRPVRSCLALLTITLAVTLSSCGMVPMADADQPPTTATTSSTKPAPAKPSSAEPTKASTPKAASTTPASKPTHPTPTWSKPMGSTPGDQGKGTALAALNALPVKGRAPMTGYSRDMFGPAWSDVDRNGCDTRNDILARDLSDETFKPGTRDCVVLTGTFVEPYAGVPTTFQRGHTTSTLIQIDHVVALGDAWATGAQQWTPAKRLAYANDPLVLLAVDGPLNGSKGASDAASWLPLNKSYRCDYVARQVSIKAAYGLWVKAAEKQAIATVLTSCPQQPVVANGKAAIPAKARQGSTAPSTKAWAAQDHRAEVLGWWN